MANTNSKTAGQAAAKQGAAAQPIPAPPAGDAGQQSDSSQPQQPADEADSQEQAAQIEQLKTELSAVTTERDTAIGQRDDYKQQVEGSKAALAHLQEQYNALSSQFAESQRQLVDRITGAVLSTQTSEAPAEQPAEEPTQEEQTKDLLRRMGLAKAWVTPDGEVAFDEKHLRHTYGDEVVDSFTVISAE